MKRLLSLCFFPLLAASAGCNSKPAPPPQDHPKLPVAVPAVMDAARRTQDMQLAAQHPSYKVLLQKQDLPTILVVPEATTDEQLKSMLWYLRTQVRDHGLQQLGIKPTASVFGTPGYASGVIHIYRGEKCAREMYVTSGPDPCGSSIHKAASYHWGDAGDPTADGGSITAASGADELVFSADDGFETDAEARRDPDGKLHAAARKRIDYATQQNAKQSKAHTDIRFATQDSGTQSAAELRIVSYQLATPEGQKSFLSEFLTLERDHLCGLGFTSLQLGTLGKPGKQYPIDCGAQKP